MGLFSSYARLVKMGKESSARMDVGASMSDMQSKLDAMNVAMAAQNSAPQGGASPDGRARRVNATATVSASRLMGTKINDGSMVEIDLTVMLPSGVPMPVTQTTIVPSLQLHRLQAGSHLAVSLDPAYPATLVVDWARVPA